MKKLSESLIFSGINPSSSKGLHLGNYFGAGKQHVEMQEKAKRAMYFIADYHSLNTVYDPKQVRSNVYNTYLDYLSFGLEPEKKNVIFFVESAIPEICELNIILNNVVSMAELSKMHAYKDKIQKKEASESINHGLFNYPVLMAADILIFNGEVVPVGEDQVQHVEIARDIARHFNARYGETLVQPQVLLQKEAARVVGTDGERKMSKSLGNDISVFNDDEIIRKQIFGIKTDPARIHPTDPGNPDKNVIFTYMKLMDYDDTKRKGFEQRYKEGKVGDVEIKESFYKFYLEYFKEIRDRRKKYGADPEKVKVLMEKNNNEAREIARETMKKVKKYYPEVMRALEDSEVIIVEDTVSNFSTGFIITYAIQRRKPVLVLWTEDKKKYFKQNFLEGVKNENVEIEKYTQKNLKEKIRTFLNKYDHHQGKHRFNLIIDNVERKYLDWARYNKRKSRTSIIRGAIRKSLNSDLEYKRYLAKEPKI